ncbi:MAG: hypothetical protein ACRC33_04280 [Gemmataceae bacterium]
MIAFEQEMRKGGVAAINFVGRFHMETSVVHETLNRVTKRLEELGVPYAVVGGMALNAHGYVRATTDVDILVTRESLKPIHDQLEGRGYLPPYAGSPHLRDTVTNVKVEFLVAGGYPGDGKPKPVNFPDPATPGVAIDVGGVKVISLEKLVELKLASGMTAVHRGKDLIDVQEIVQALKLPADFAERLDPFVREEFAKRWAFANAPRAEWEGF